ncbi:hypothetical protein, variant 7 [Aphanomyces invadans]|nr:hypothetical protein, variant 4 [Aphanomyces invadans]XP_008869280.1 hypothetical protein, variant 5 [Aphanomyces invadans]XP_008869281.1 hypothetical protein, variant 6 [Aphanomyces invadans]XP_008869282.1 hypothetical protein, variant 7 [Aphanomyces invadans]ETW02674.1 hypothetical protein, variant 4 [Aphanomyces invadans]ETW02675.1 hypothetical protein, variant 5 [Aphanomyces invadans]ETW02676.1 hypothetical protein, variant 6 [Aphanomyces invadans]ETW02677.1 hypothetical protein, vari|eukprot:XP_008869279.1 hypothetical protein, variant 4 [Aphanomyces invadans]
MDTVSESGHSEAPVAVEAAPQPALPFSEENLSICLEVLGTIAKDLNVVELPAMRTFRKMLAPVSDYMESRKFKGKGRKKYLEDQELRREKEARNIKRKMNDHKYINSATLRRARVEKLNELLEQGKGEEENMLPLIADGAVDEANTQTMLLENGKPAEVPKVELNKQRSCYTCKVRYEALHHFYDQLCPSCAEVNYSKRMQSADLHGKVALVTGARVKIGYQTTLKLLLAGATVIATSRFPHDTAERYAAHPDYATFKDRLHVFGIDFRDLVHLEHFMDFVLQTYPRLDVVIHNACQTIRRPTSYYAHMMPKESTPFLNLPANIQATLQQQQAFTEALHRDTNALLSDGSTKLATGNSNHHAIPSALKSQVPMLLEDHDMTGSSLFPQGRTDVNGQQLDLRTTNSWVLKMGQVSTPEVAEVFAINTLAPFIMNSRLRPLLEKTEAKAKYIINVSAMEGKFYRYKTPNHPHTNMAKAALNMMTRTCAEELSKYGIYMNSVDTGWINDENPLEKAHKYAATANFQTPIDEIDAAARILDPVFVGYNTGKSDFGLFFKDYHETEW